MRYAILNGDKISAEDYKKTLFDDLKCQCCESEVLAKQGDIKQWHFAHVSKNNCSDWWKPMTQWHKEWQDLFSKENIEIVHKCEKTGEKHIADVKLPNGTIIEFQHSSISKEEIELREQFYGKKMIWVLDSETFKINQVKKYNWVSNSFKNIDKYIKAFPEMEYLKDEILKHNMYAESEQFQSYSSFFQIAKNDIYIDLKNGNLLKVQFKRNDILYFGELKIDYNSDLKYKNTYIERKNWLSFYIHAYSEGKSDTIGNGFTIDFYLDNKHICHNYAGKIISKTTFLQNLKNYKYS